MINENQWKPMNINEKSFYRQASYSWWSEWSRDGLTTDQWKDLFSELSWESKSHLIFNVAHDWNLFFGFLPWTTNASYSLGMDAQFDLRAKTTSPWQKNWLGMHFIIKYVQSLYNLYLAKITKFFAKKVIFGVNRG